MGGDKGALLKLLAGERGALTLEKGLGPPKVEGCKLKPLIKFRRMNLSTQAPTHLVNKFAKRYRRRRVIERTVIRWFRIRLVILVWCLRGDITNNRS